MEIFVGFDTAVAAHAALHLHMQQDEDPEYFLHCEHSRYHQNSEFKQETECPANMPHILHKLTMFFVYSVHFFSLF